MPDGPGTVLLDRGRRGICHVVDDLPPADPVSTGAGLPTGDGIDHGVDLGVETVPVSTVVLVSHLNMVNAGPTPHGSDRTGRGCHRLAAELKGPAQFVAQTLPPSDDADQRGLLGPSR